VAEIADELCLTQQYLRAIEDDDVKSLPGVFFYKNFVRQYAAIVGVKDADLRAGVEALSAAAEEPVLPGIHAQPPLRPLDPIVADSNRRYFAGARMGVSIAGLAAVLLACSGFYAWWTRAAEAAVTKSHHAPAAVQPAPVSTPAVAVPVAQPSAAPAADSPDSDPAPDPSPSETAMVPVTAGHTSAVAAISRTVDGINQVVLNLSATEKTWLSITSEGKRLFSGFLEPSQTKTLTGLEAARMTVGNAGGIEVRLNGKPIGPIGKSGQVRVVVFTPGTVEVLPLETPVAPSETL